MRWLLAAFVLMIGLGHAEAQLLNAARLAGGGSVPVPETPFNGTSCGASQWPFLSTISAINYDCGGQGVAFSVWSNPGCGAVQGTYRADSVNFFAPGASGAPFRIGCTKVGDYFNTKVNINSAGPYIISLGVSSADAGTARPTWNVYLDSTLLTATPLSVPSTGDNTVFTTISTPQFNATLGNHTIKIQVAANGTNGFGSDLGFIVGSVVGTTTLTPPPAAQAVGFTQLAYNADFSTANYALPTSPGSNPLGVNSGGWLGCSPGGGGSHEWYVSPPNFIQLPCSGNGNGSVTTGVPDPAVPGSTTVHLNWAGNCPNTCTGGPPWDQITLGTGSPDGGHSWGTLLFPSNAYIEVKVRPVFTFGGNFTGQGWDNWNVANYLADVNSVFSGSFTPLEDDIVNGWSGSNGVPQQTILFYRCNWGVDCGNNSGVDSVAANSPSPFDPRTRPNTYGLLLRFNGSSGGNNGTACTFLNDVAVNTLGIAGGRNCLPLNPSSQQANSYRHVSQMILGDSGQVMEYYAYFYRVWVPAGCAWQTSECIQTSPGYTTSTPLGSSF